MPVMERRERRRLALRESILEAARQIVRVDGLRLLTMRRIAEAVDYSPASLYTHFESREALLAELCREGMAALRLALETSLGGLREPRARLTALGNAYVRFALNNRETYRLMFMEDPAITSSIFAAVDWDEGARALALINAPLAELRAAGTLRKSANLVRLADLFWTILHGIASLRLGCPAMPATDDASLIATAVATIVDGSRPAR